MNTDWNAEFTAENVQIERRESVYNGFFQMDKITLRHACFEEESIQVTRELFVRGEAVCVLLYDPWKHAVVMVEQFRVGALEHPRSPWLLELVAGIVEEGEQPEDVAGRESAEETGLQVDNIRPITRYWVSPGGTNESIHLMCGRIDSRDAGGIHGLASEGEDIKVHVLDADRAFEMVAQGKIDNAASIIGLQWLQLNVSALRVEWLK